MASRLHDCVVLEAHRDSFELTRRRRLGEEHPLVNGLLPRFIHGGYDVVVFVVGGDSVTHRDLSDRPLEGSLDVLDFFLNECQAAQGRVSIIKCKEDVPTTPERGHVHFLLELEGGRPFQEDYSSGRRAPEKLATLRAFYRMGVRSVQLTHNGRNELADGLDDRRSRGGLSEYGLAVVRELNRLHMMIGISHLSDAGIMDVLENSCDPVFASHCNARAVFDHLRNLTDEQLAALARNGGIIGIHFWAPILSRGRRPTLDDFIAHIDHVAQLIGPQHIGFGILGNDPTYTRYFPDTANDTMTSPDHPEGMEYHDQAALLMEELDKRGYSREDIYGIMGGNYCRVMRQVLPGRGQDVIW